MDKKEFLKQVLDDSGGDIPSYEDAIPVIKHLLQENERLKKLAELHEAYLKECPCDYDITSESLQAWNNLQTFKKENNL